ALDNPTRSRCQPLAPLALACSPRPGLVYQLRCVLVSHALHLTNSRMRFHSSAVIVARSTGTLLPERNLRSRRFSSRTNSLTSWAASIAARATLCMSASAMRKRSRLSPWRKSVAFSTASRYCLIASLTARSPCGIGCSRRVTKRRYLPTFTDVTEQSQPAPPTQHALDGLCGQCNIVTVDDAE